MARESRSSGPKKSNPMIQNDFEHLDPGIDQEQQEKEKDHPQDDLLETDIEKTKAQEKKVVNSYSKYKRIPKYKTHVPLNTRIPREVRKEMEAIGRKLGVPLNKNSGFFQEFTIDALRKHIAEVKKDLGMN